MQPQVRQLQFLQKRIEHHHNAVFFNLSDSVSRLPTSVVSTLKVDDTGHIWFVVKRLELPLKEVEMEFPVRLDFFKKNTNYHLQIRGKGFSVTDPEEVSAFLGSLPGSTISVYNDTVLVKVKMLNADYFETSTSEKTNWWQNAISSISNWFGSSNESEPNSYSQS